MYAYAYMSIYTYITSDVEFEPGSQDFKVQGSVSRGLVYDERFSGVKPHSGMPIPVELVNQHLGFRTQGRESVPELGPLKFSCS